MPHCQKCAEEGELRTVLDVAICPSCVVELRVWLAKPRYRNAGVWEDHAHALGRFTAQQLARAMGRTRMQAKDWILRAYRRGVLVRVAPARYELAPQRAARRNEERDACALTASAANEALPTSVRRAMKARGAA